MKNILIFLFSTIFGSFLLAQNLYLGQSLSKGQKYYSQNRQYYLVFQNDGNLVMYSKKNTPVWDSKTENKGSRAEFQRDGNFVVYNGSGTAVFNAKTNGKGSRLAIQDDGNLVIYGTRNNAVWASKENSGTQPGNYNTGIIYRDKSISKNQKFYSENGEYYLTFQTDGNLVLYYRNSSSPIWSSNTVGVGSRAIFQADGNLVVYDRSNKAVFNTNTNNKNADKLAVQNDGNLVIYNTSDNPIWAVK